MSHGQHNSAHSYRTPASQRTRGTRLTSKLGKGRLSLKRLEQLLKPTARDATRREEEP